MPGSRQPTAGQPVSPGIQLLTCCSQFDNREQYLQKHAPPTLHTPIFSLDATSHPHIQTLALQPEPKEAQHWELQKLPAGGVGEGAARQVHEAAAAVLAADPSLAECPSKLACALAAALPFSQGWSVAVRRTDPTGVPRPKNDQSYALRTLRHSFVVVSRWAEPPSSQEDLRCQQQHPQAGSNGSSGSHANGHTSPSPNSSSGSLSTPPASPGQRPGLNRQPSLGRRTSQMQGQVQEQGLIIVEPAFASHFQLPRARPAYAAHVSQLPALMVTDVASLAACIAELAVKVAAEHAALGAPLPPWRSRAALQSKWLAAAFTDTPAGFEEDMYCDFEEELEIGCSPVGFFDSSTQPQWLLQQQQQAGACPEDGRRSGQSDSAAALLSGEGTGAAGAEGPAAGGAAAAATAADPFARVSAMSDATTATTTTTGNGGDSDSGGADGPAGWSPRSVLPPAPKLQPAFPVLGLGVAPAVAGALPGKVAPGGVSPTAGAMRPRGVSPVRGASPVGLSPAGSLKGVGSRQPLQQAPLKVVRGFEPSTPRAAGDAGACGPGSNRAGSNSDGGIADGSQGPSSAVAEGWTHVGGVQLFTPVPGPASNQAGRPSVVVPSFARASCPATCVTAPATGTSPPPAIVPFVSAARPGAAGAVGAVGRPAENGGPGGVRGASTEGTSMLAIGLQQHPSVPLMLQNLVEGSSPQMGFVPLPNTIAAAVGGGARRASAGCPPVASGAAPPSGSSSGSSPCAASNSGKLPLPLQQQLGGGRVSSNGEQAPLSPDGQKGASPVQVLEPLSVVMREPRTGACEMMPRAFKVKLVGAARP